MSYNQMLRAVEEHFDEALLDDLTLTQRAFPGRVLPDIHLALAELADVGFTVRHFFAAQQGNQPVVQFAQLYDPSPMIPVVTAAPQYLDVDVGEDRPVRCLTHGLWLLEAAGRRCAVLFHLGPAGAAFQVAAAPARGPDVAAAVFKYLEREVEKGRSYRGKVLSLEAETSYTGQSRGLLVHRLRPVPRDTVVLPPHTLDLLDRNVVRFAAQRARLREAGLATRKGLLFHGPPGTGKTHTLHYLAAAVPGQTTLLIGAGQVAYLGEYMTLARLFQPCLVVIEDVDLIARDRAVAGPGEQVLLNKLLNEMDGLRPDADVIVVLTTNRPEVLEDALAARPGRVDQAVEFPYPDADGRARLMRLYAGRVAVPADVVDRAVARTAGVSGSFVKELMRRAAQFAFDRGAAEIGWADAEAALDELLVRGSPLNRKLLGAAHPAGGAGATQWTPDEGRP